MLTPYIMKKLFTLFIVSIGFTGASYAQPYIGLGFIGSSALNEFCDSSYRNGYGFNMEFFTNNFLRKAVNPNVFALRAGIGFDIQGSGSEKRSVILNTPNSDPGTEKYANSHLGFRATLRMSFMEGMKFSPYIDGFAGLRGFYTHRTLSIDQKNPEYESNTSEQIMGNWTRRYGASVGAMFRLNRIISLDTRITYSAGTNADWSNLNTVVRENNTVSYRVSNSFTDLFMYNVGFVFRIDPKPKTRTTTSPTNPTTTPTYPVTPKEEVIPKKKKRNVVTPTTPNTPSPTPKKPLEVKPTPKPAPKPKPEN